MFNSQNTVGFQLPEMSVLAHVVLGRVFPVQFDDGYVYVPCMAMRVAKPWFLRMGVFAWMWVCHG